MTDTDLTGVWRTRSGSVVRVTGAVPGQLDRWAVTHPDDDEPSIHTGTFIHASWSRVPDAEPAEAEAEQLPDWCEGDPSHLPPAVTAPVLPSDEIPEPVRWIPVAFPPRATVPSPCGKSCGASERSSRR